MGIGINKVIIVGNLGGNPDKSYMPSGKTVCTISIASSESWNDKETGDKQERTEWHRVVFYGRLAEIAGDYLKKGSQVYVEGKLQTRKWEDKEGKERWTTEIVANQMQMLGDRMSQGASNQNNVTKPDSSSNEFVDEEFDDDIPF